MLQSEVRIFQNRMWFSSASTEAALARQQRRRGSSTSIMAALPIQNLMRRLYVNLITATMGKVVIIAMIDYSKQMF